MRPTLRVLARYLEAGTPTGLTGVWTHGTPRSTLLYLYGTTLSKLQSVPESSLYRQSVEAVTKHRMEMVEKMVPPGYSEWVSKAQALLKDRPTHFKIQSGLVDGSGVRTVKMGDRVFIVGSKHEEADVRGEEWDGEPVGAVDLKDVDEATMDELRSQGHFQQPGEKQTVEKDGSVRVDHARQLTDLPEEEQVQWEEEPQLTADQISELETRIGAGLIEEVIQVAEGELRLVNSMTQSKVWGDLEDKPVDGQWEYFDRKSM